MLVGLTSILLILEIKNLKLPLFTVKAMVHRVKQTVTLLVNSQAELTGLQQDHHHSEEYFAEQWERQRAMQLSIIETGSTRLLREKIESLVEIDELISNMQLVQMKHLILIAITSAYSFFPV